MLCVLVGAAAAYPLVAMGLVEFPPGVDLRNSDFAIRRPVRKYWTPAGP